MSWSIITGTTAQGATPGAATIATSAIDTTGADLIVVAVWGLGPTDSIVDSKSNTWLTALSGSSNNPAYAETIWYTQNPVIVGSGHTFTITYDGYGAMAVVAVSGSLTTGNPIDVTNFHVYGTLGGGDTTEQPGSITPTQNNELLIYFNALTGNNASGSPYSCDSGFIQRQFIDTQGPAAGQSGGMIAWTLVQGTAGAINPTMTRTGATTSSGDVAAIVSFLPAPAVISVPFGILGTFTTEW